MVTKEDKNSLHVVKDCIISSLKSLETLKDNSYNTNEVIYLYLY